MDFQHMLEEAVRGHFSLFVNNDFQPSRTASIVKESTLYFGVIMRVHIFAVRPMQFLRKKKPISKIILSKMPVQSHSAENSSSLLEDVGKFGKCIPLQQSLTAIGPLYQVLDEVLNKCKQSALATEVA